MDGNPLCVCNDTLIHFSGFPGIDWCIYAFVTYVIALAGVYTATMVPYNAMIGTTTSNPVDRGNLSTSRTLAGFVGAMGVTSVVLPVVNFFGGDKQAWTWMAAVFGVISTVLLLILFEKF